MNRMIAVRISPKAALTPCITSHIRLASISQHPEHDDPLLHNRKSVLLVLLYMKNSRISVITVEPVNFDRFFQ